MIRLLDLFFSSLALILFFPILVLLYVFLLFESPNPVLKQARVGRFEKIFVMYKFRTMIESAREAPTHEISVNAITFLGRFLRKSKLDEVPQLWNVIRGEMSLVGARPCLVKQIELIELRRQKKIFLYAPGVTGLAQIRNVDMSSIRKLVKFEFLMYKNLNVCMYLVLILKTFFETVVKVFKS